ncbi:hypothetical protein T492DRAFT_1125494 [Pavlovales sp. CCMP2436]|nr:hypothetical protein T492DRAFT_1125494 [Pavlovales sp. CCMP2436]
MAIAYAPRRGVRIHLYDARTFTSEHRAGYDDDDRRDTAVTVAAAATTASAGTLIAGSGSNNATLLPIVIVACPRATMSSWLATAHACTEAFVREKGACFEVLPKHVSDIKVTQTYVKRAQASDGLVVVVQSSEVHQVVARLTRGGYRPYALVHDEICSERTNMAYAAYPYILGISATPCSLAEAIIGMRHDLLWRRLFGCYTQWSWMRMWSRTNRTEQSIAHIASVHSHDVASAFYPWLIECAEAYMPPGFHVEHVRVQDRSLTYLDGSERSDPTSQISLAQLIGCLQLSLEDDAGEAMLEMTIVRSFNAPDTSLRAHQCMQRLRRRIDDDEVTCVVCYEGMVLGGAAGHVGVMLITPCCTNLVCTACHTRLNVCPCCRVTLRSAAERIVNGEAPSSVQLRPTPMLPMPGTLSELLAAIGQMPVFANAFEACEQLFDMMHACGMRRVSLTLKSATRRCIVLALDTEARRGRELVSANLLAFEADDPLDRMRVLVLHSANVRRHIEVAGTNLPFADAIVFTGTAHDQVIGRVLRMGRTGQPSKLVIKMVSG